MHQFLCAIPVFDALHELRQHDELWDANPLRTRYPGSAHSDVSDIWLRFNEVDLSNPTKVFDDPECINYPAFEILTRTKHLLYVVMMKVSAGRLGKCVLAKLPPGGVIKPHVDEGYAARYYTRYHLVLRSNPACYVLSEGKQTVMKPSELWLFDNQEEHSVVNEGDTDRIHLIVDAR